MSNMSYCRFENTSNDLVDCAEHIGENIEDMSKYEFEAMVALIETAKEIAESYDETDIQQWKTDFVKEDEQ